jgi:hypothetical protein
LAAVVDPRGRCPRRERAAEGAQVGSSFMTATVFILRRSIRRSPTCGSEC